MQEEHPRKRSFSEEQPRLGERYGLKWHGETETVGNGFLRSGRQVTALKRGVNGNGPCPEKILSCTHSKPNARSADSLVRESGSKKATQKQEAKTFHLQRSNLPIKNQKFNNLEVARSGLYGATP